jgi:DNA topoisomerase IB
VSGETLATLHRTSEKSLSDEAELQRIKALAVPPGYASVWISPKANGHLQATGRDARGRKQYRYHKRFREVRDEAKYHRLRLARVIKRCRDLPGEELSEYLDDDGTPQRVSSDDVNGCASRCAS